MTEPAGHDENLKRCPQCGKDMLTLHSKWRTWICRNCGYQEPLPDPDPGQTGATDRDNDNGEQR